jgi:hypothetical protein
MRDFEVYLKQNSRLNCDKHLPNISSIITKLCNETTDPFRSVPFQLGLLLIPLTHCTSSYAPSACSGETHSNFSIFLSRYLE